jgi:hypothetical protein
LGVTNEFVQGSPPRYAFAATPKVIRVYLDVIKSLLDIRT